MPNRDGDVLRAWVRLEAAAKAFGTGIGRLLTEEGVIGGETRSAEAGAARALEIRDIDVPHGHVAAVAASDLPATIRVVVFPDDADALVQFLARSDC
jgi:4'-phosphopantetheinyl transferase